MPTGLISPHSRVRLRTLFAHVPDFRLADRKADPLICNLDNMAIGPLAILEFTRAVVNHAGNLEPGKICPVACPRTEATLAAPGMS